MAITFDANKSAKNIADRGLPFELVKELEWHTAMVMEDNRKDYGEVRLKVLAFLGDRLYATIVTPRSEDLRVISFRKANKLEVKTYGKRER